MQGTPSASKGFSTAVSAEDLRGFSTRVAEGKHELTLVMVKRSFFVYVSKALKRQQQLKGAKRLSVMRSVLSLEQTAAGRGQSRYRAPRRWGQFFCGVCPEAAEINFPENRLSGDSNKHYPMLCP